jgi:hypothetical protein
MDSTPVIALPTAFMPVTITGDLFIPLIFYAVAAMYTIFTGVLYYHWNAYANNKKVTALTYTIYLVITLPLISTMGLLVLFA